MNKDLERLLELHHFKTDQEGNGLDEVGEEEYDSLKSKIEEQLKENQNLKERDDQWKTIHEEYKRQYEILKQKLEKIEEFSRDWDNCAIDDKGYARELLDELKSILESKE